MPNPLEALRQYKLRAAPALEGVEVTQSIMPFLPGAGVMQGLKQATPKRLEDAVFNKIKEAGTFSGNRLNRVPTEGKFGLSSATPRKAMERLGEFDPEFTPVGGEWLYNAGRQAVRTIADPVEQAFQKILLRGGR